MSFRAARGVKVKLIYVCSSLSSMPSTQCHHQLVAFRDRCLHVLIPTMLLCTVYVRWVQLAWKNEA
jgi:hypothetical protein